MKEPLDITDEVLQCRATLSNESQERVICNSILNIMSLTQDITHPCECSHKKEYPEDINLKPKTSETSENACPKKRSKPSTNARKVNNVFRCPRTKTFNDVIDDIYSQSILNVTRVKELNSDTFICKEEYPKDKKATASPKVKDKILKRNDRGESLLHLAVRKNNIEEIRHILNEAKFLLYEADNACWTPLHDCVQKGNLKMTKILLKAGASVNAVGADYMTPLMIAVKEDFPNIAEVLLRYGANTQEVNFYGKDAIDFSSYDRREFYLCLFQKFKITSTLCQRKYFQERPKIEVAIHDFNNKKIRVIFACRDAINYNIYFIRIHNYITSDITHFVTNTINIPCTHLLASILTGKWILSVDWLKFCINFCVNPGELTYSYGPFNRSHDDIINKQLPPLFDGINFYFYSPKGDPIYSYNGIEITKKQMWKLIQLGGGKILIRLPSPSRCNLDHYPWHLRGTKMSNCSSFIIYASNCRPELSYNMPELKHVSANYIVNTIMKYSFSDERNDLNSCT